MFVIIGIVVVIGAIVSGYLDGARELEGAAAAGGAGDYWRGRDRDGADCESDVHSEENCGGIGGGVWRIALYEGQISGDAEDAGGTASASAQRRIDGVGGGQRCAGQEPSFFQVSKILKGPSRAAFVCDTLRMAASGGVEAFDMDQMMERDMEVHHHEQVQPVAALSTMADSLPGLGIVAAVLGVVITMGALGGPPEEIGHKVAAALVGTFLGILLCYGFIGPVASTMAKTTEDEQAYYYVLRVVLVSFIKGSPPTVAVEFGRRAIPRACEADVPGSRSKHQEQGGEAAPAAAAA